ncbi:MAG TPA: MG2 domain-containing protein [Phycisphaerales bacterium]|nr:MG2 domain-containing protein [Phycisphaerales bacterium]
MKSLLTLAVLSLVFAVAQTWSSPAGARSDEPVPQDPVSPPAEYAALKEQAEKAYADKSYADARDLYQRAAALALPKIDKRWVDFRLADTSWRAQAGSNTADSTVFDKSFKQLEDVLRSVERVEDRDIVWAEASESIADMRWTRREWADWGGGWPHYNNALDYWASSPDLDVARDRYLQIVWKMAEPHWMDRGYWNYWPHVPLEIFDNAFKIAKTDDDKARAQYQIAMTLLRDGDWRRQMRVEQTLQGALAIGKSAEWYDDTLYAYAEFLAGPGRPIVLEDGTTTRQHDYNKALELLKQLTSEYRKGQTPFWDNAQAMIADITTPRLNVGVSNFFLPNSQIQYALSWRNVKEITLEAYKVNLTTDIAMRSGTREDLGQWLARIDVSKGEKVREWKKDTQDKGDHEPGQSQEKFDEPLPPGAYVIEASAEGAAKGRDIILVTDTAVALKTAGNQALAWCVNAVDSAPVPNANVRIWKAVWREDKWIIADTTKQSNADGLCVVNEKDFPGVPSEPGQYFAAMESDARQAMAFSGANWYQRDRNGWRIYAFTDRPAYRPTEKVEWKILARQQQAEGWQTPANATLFYEITDPRGSKLKDGQLKLNDFGSAWDGLELAATSPLGEYNINFWLEQNHNNHVGGATLFRMEEYKLPEFMVKVSTPEENGKRKAYLLGDYVEAAIQADYYFGGPVANASVEVVVRQNPYYRWWSWPREFPWCYDEQNPYRWWYGGGGQEIKRETLRTDSTGKAILTFETPGNSGQDMQYEIEARVTDSSRREITGNASVRVTQHRYYVYARSEHNIRKPNDEARIEFQAIDANDQPWKTEGNVRVTRELWTEIWLDSSGREVTGGELQRLQQDPIFPPAPTQKGMSPWRLKFRGYKSEEVLKTKVQLDEAGKATFAFTPQKEGYYRVEWRSLDPGTSPVVAETWVWVATDKSADLAYRSGGLQIIIDKDTVRSGQTAPVMIATPTNNRYVLFSVEGFDLYSYQVVHVTGDVKLVEVPIRNSYTPNVWFSAMMAHDGQMYADSKEVVVPPVEEYLNIEVASDRSAYQPGEEGTFTVKTTDHDGKPVSAEVAIAIVDESVTYIQQDYAGDPRPFFFQQRQYNIVQGGSTFNQKSFVRLVRGEGDVIMDEKLALKEMEEAKNGLDDRSETRFRRDAQFAGGGGGRGGAMPPGAPAPAREMAAADAAMPMSSASGGLGAEGGRVSGNARMEMDQLRKADGGDKNGPAQGQEPAVQVRTDFRSTLLWNPTITTDEDGTAKVTLKYADSLTTWKATARAASKGAAFGIGDASTRTRMPLIARLQAPRFFLAGDTAVVSGVINNNTDEPMNVRPEIRIEGLKVLGLIREGQLTQDAASISVPANSEMRVDWQVAVENAGEAKIMLAARSDKYADGMEKTYTVYEHGVMRYLATSGKVRGDDVTVTLNIPAARKPESTVFNVQVAPSMAVTMLDALPYLIDYPYGCTEQTMSRYLPAVITAKTLGDLGIKPETIIGKVFGGIEQATADKTHTKAKGDLKKLDEITQASLDRLYDFQHGDGGWGWWKEGESDHFMSAYVVWGLSLAKEAGLDVKQEAMDRGAKYLNEELVEEENAPDMQAWILHGLSRYRAVMKQTPHEFETKALDTIFKKRDQLNAYTRALTALAAHQMGDAAKAKTLVDNLRNGVKRDDRPDSSVIVKGVQGQNQAVMGTAHWGEDGLSWRWSDGGVEATSFALRAILAIDRKLVRDGDNQIRILRKAGAGPIYFAASSEFYSLEEPVPPSGSEIFVRREYYKLVPTPTLLKGVVYDRLPLGDGDSVNSGERVEVVLTIEAKNNYEYLVFEDLKPAGLEAVAIRSGEPLYTREMKKGAVDLTFGDGKKSETDVRREQRISGPEDFTGRQAWVYQELRDRKVAMFIDHLPEGIWELRYDLRAETPGRFHALPVLGSAMYVPEIRCNSAEIRIAVTDAK